MIATSFTPDMNAAHSCTRSAPWLQEQARAAGRAGGVCTGQALRCVARLDVEAVHVARVGRGTRQVDEAAALPHNARRAARHLRDGVGAAQLFDQLYAQRAAAHYDRQQYGAAGTGRGMGGTGAEPTFVWHSSGLQGKKQLQVR
jgi:hypothetical protein